MNLWEQHFAKWKALRARWKGCAVMGSLSADYARCLREPIADTEALAGGLGRRAKGKHSRYQGVWNWNALAYQQYKFQGDYLAARRCLEEGLKLACTLQPERYGHDAASVEAVWIVILLNFLRLDYREGRRQQGAEKLGQLRRLLSGADWDPSVFGEGPAAALRSGRLRFSFGPDHVAFVRAKLDEEERRWGGLSP